jgi:hypothetical protein
MPIPLLVWGAVAAGTAWLAWKNWDKIEKFIDSEEGKDLFRKFGETINETTAGQYDEAAQERMKPHLKILLKMSPGESILALPAYLKTMSKEDIGILGAYCTFLEGRMDDDDTRRRLKTIAETCSRMRHAG